MWRLARGVVKRSSFDGVSPEGGSQKAGSRWKLCARYRRLFGIIRGQCVSIWKPSRIIWTVSASIWARRACIWDLSRSISRICAVVWTVDANFWELDVSVWMPCEINWRPAVFRWVMWVVLCRSNAASWRMRKKVTARRASKTAASCESSRRIEHRLLHVAAATLHPLRLLED